MVNDLQTIDRGDGVNLAFRRVSGRGPTLVWLSGFKSDMAGTKAEALSAWAQARGQGFLRFDYSGHGLSGDAFEACDVSRWRADVLRMVDAATEGPLVLVGSSMGGWMALLAALARPERVAALLLIAPAADFTQALLEPNLPDDARRALAETGRWARPSPYDDAPYVITQRLIEDGRNWLLLNETIPFGGPVRVLQGMRDDDVPWRHAVRTAEAIASDDVRVTLVKDGDHRLSRPQDIALLLETAEALAG
ncbi:MAG: alpha/beta hydrolase [Hyphomonadaceae bacterium]|nr:alpha/beta hydrolase [Hyphomonadaceae bacterium]